MSYKDQNKMLDNLIAKDDFGKESTELMITIRELQLKVTKLESRISKVVKYAEVYLSKNEEKCIKKILKYKEVKNESNN